MYALLKQNKIATTYWYYICDICVAYIISLIEVGDVIAILWICLKSQTWEGWDFNSSLPLKLGSRSFMSLAK